MSTSAIFGLVLAVAGCLGLAYGGFSYTRETHRANIGTIELSVNDDRRVNVPIWASVGAIAAGGILLLAGRRRG
jgi:TRAP-type C4-dicarboxylate transport system permease small subunit